MMAFEVIRFIFRSSLVVHSSVDGWCIVVVVGFMLSFFNFLPNLQYIVRGQNNQMYAFDVRFLRGSDKHHTPDIIPVFPSVGVNGMSIYARMTVYIHIPDSRVYNIKRINVFVFRRNMESKMAHPILYGNGTKQTH